MAGHMTRRAHKKSKTGCVTCKARRIKCSEERPACLRCVRSGRLCEGYTADFMQNASNRDANLYALAPYQPPQSSLTPYFGGAMSPLELRSLQFFHDHTVPALAGCFESSLWQRLLLQISVTEPGLRHAMIAVGFLQKLSDLHGLPALDFQDSDNTLLDRHDSFTLDQYMKAVTLIRKRLSSGDPDSIITLVACILFVCLEFLRGERRAAFAHLRSGLEIIKSKLETERKMHGSLSVVHSKMHGLTETDLAPMFARMGLLSTLHRQPRDEAFSGILDLDSEPWPELEPFETIEQARIVCINQMNATIRFAWMVITGQFPDENTIEMGRAETLARLEGWSRAFQPYLSTAKFRAATFDLALRGPALLRVHHVMAMIWARVVRCPQDEWSYDFLLDEFKCITEACEAIINLSSMDPSTEGRPPSFSLDHGLIPPLFFVALKCRDPSTRRHAISLIYKAPRREGIWDAISAAKVAEVHVAVEEEPVAQPSNQDWPPLQSRIIDFDMRMRDPNNPSYQLVILRMVRADGQEEQERREQYIYYKEVGMQSIPYSDKALKEVVYRDPISIFESEIPLISDKGIAV